MNINDRQKEILKIIHRDGIAHTKALAKKFCVSTLTIRRDISLLETYSLIQRITGGAISRMDSKEIVPLVFRIDINTRAKIIISEYAVSLIKNGDSVGIDAGSTSIEIAKRIPITEQLTIITSNLNVVEVLRKRKDIQLIVLGGVLNFDEQNLVGNFALKSMKDFYLDKFFLTCMGIDEKKGITTNDHDNSRIKSTIIKNSKEVILLADSSKFSVVSFSYICGFGSIHRLITEKRPPDEIIQKAHLNKTIIDVVNANGQVDQI